MTNYSLRFYVWFYLELFHLLHSYDVTYTWGDDANAISQVQDPLRAQRCLQYVMCWHGCCIPNKWKHHEQRGVELSPQGCCFRSGAHMWTLHAVLRGRKQLSSWTCPCQAAPSEPFLRVSSRGWPAEAQTEDISIENKLPEVQQGFGTWLPEHGN
jgi:hypothetical protein